MSLTDPAAPREVSPYNDASRGAARQRSGCAIIRNRRQDFLDGTETKTEADEETPNVPAPAHLAVPARGRGPAARCRGPRDPPHAARAGALARDGSGGCAEARSRFRCSRSAGRPPPPIRHCAHVAPRHLPRTQLTVPEPKRLAKHSALPLKVARQVLGVPADPADQGGAARVEPRQSQEKQAPLPGPCLDTPPARQERAFRAARCTGRA